MQFFSNIVSAGEAAKIKKGFPWWLTVIFSVAAYLIFFIASLFVGGFASVIVSLTGNVSNPAELAKSPLMMAIVLLATVFMIAGTILFARVIDKIPLKDLGLKKDKFAVRYLGGLAAGFIMFSAAVFLAKILGAADLASSTDTELKYIFFMIPGWIIQGFAEEFLCRGYIMTAVAKRYSAFWGVIINSVMFALFHGLNTGLTVLALVNLFLFGLFASVTYLISENIWFVAALHSVWNFVQGNFYGIPVSGNAANPKSTIFITAFDPDKTFVNGGTFGIEGGICASVVLTAGIVIAYIIYRKKHPELK